MFRYHYKSPFKKRTPRVAARPGMKDRSRGTESSDRSYGRPGDARASNGAIELGVQDVGPGSKGGPDTIYEPFCTTKARGQVGLDRL